MHRPGLDALILLSPEAFRHATGAPPGVATMWRQAGAVAVLVPADAGLAEMAVASDLFAPAFRPASHVTDLRESPIWVEAMAVPGFDPTADAAAQLRALWQAEGRGRISPARPPSIRPRWGICATRWPSGGWPGPPRGRDGGDRGARLAGAGGDAGPGDA
jgi:Xaa-Pro dipeptidase